MKLGDKAIRTVIGILQDEVDGNVSAALKKMAGGYTMTWMDAGLDGKELFPTTTPDLTNELKSAYAIRGRRYDIRNIAHAGNVVFVELVESFPSKKKGKVYRTPLVLVLEMQGDKIKTGRHYLDPRLSQKFLRLAQINKAYKGGATSLMIIH